MRTRFNNCCVLAVLSSTKHATRDFKPRIPPPKIVLTDATLAAYREPTRFQVRNKAAVDKDQKAGEFPLNLSCQMTPSVSSRHQMRNCSSVLLLSSRCLSPPKKGKRWHSRVAKTEAAKEKN
ncbi:hypothetical protein BaRGS_00000138 [Batillaria attramentaria]|uniref:Uncharacterized protein n=1 Tax=Batillaria attramentaria TaxID=370345 RepID=A0ABD0MBF1_9CAEN